MLACFILIQQSVLCRDFLHYSQRQLMASSEVIQLLTPLLAECVVCLGSFAVSNPRMIVCIAAHPICQKCTTRLLVEYGNKKCPICRASFKEGSERAHEMQHTIIENIMPFLIKNSAKQRRQQILSKQTSVQMIITYFQQQVRHAVKTQAVPSLIGLGNPDQIFGLYEDYHPVTILHQMGFQPEKLSNYDLLSYFSLWSNQTESLLSWYEEKFSKHPENGALLFGIANLHYLRRQYEKSYEIYCQLLDRNQFCSTRRTLLAYLRASTKVKNSDKKAVIIDRLSADGSETRSICAIHRDLDFVNLIENKAVFNDFRDQVEIGKIFMHFGEYQLASNCFLRAISMNHKLHSLSFLLAECYFKRGLVDPAISEFQAFVELKTSFPVFGLQALLRLGSCNLSIKKVEDAKNYFMMAESMCPGKSTKLQIMRCYVNENYFEQTIRISRDIQRKDGQKDKTYLVAVSLYSLRRFRQVIEYLESQAIIQTKCYPILVQSHRMELDYESALKVAKKWSERTNQSRDALAVVTEITQELQKKSTKNVNTSQ